MSATTHVVRYGNPDLECRYPVLLNGLYLGRVFRWHGTWYAAPAGHDQEHRVADGRTGKELAAAHLVGMHEAGEITPRRAAEDESDTPRGFVGPVPLLHPRMPATPTNIRTAHKVMAALAEYHWRPLGGYPGSDNPWFVQCELCAGREERDDWAGPLYWSHLRGRNGNPPSPFRHPGCLSEAEVRSRIAAYHK